MHFAGKFGLACQTDMVHTELIRRLLEGQQSSPIRIVGFNTAEGWYHDVSDDIAAELARACADRRTILQLIVDFIADHPSK